MRNLVFPLEGLNHSGGIRIVTLLANYLCMHGYSVEFIVPSYAKNSFYDLHKSIQLTVINTGNSRFRKLIFLVQMLRAKTHAGKNIYFATGYKTPIYIFIAKMINLSNSPIIYLIQHYEVFSQVENEKNLLKKKLLLGLARFGYAVHSKKIVVSDWIKQQLSNHLDAVSLSEVSIIPNGLDLNLFKPLTPKISQKNQALIHIGVIGSNNPNKGYLFFIEAISRLPKELLANIQLSVLTQEVIPAPPLEKYVMLRAQNDLEIAEFYRSLDFFVFNSFSEGFGLPPLEAMACGTPVICSRCGGVAEYITDENALSYTPGTAAELNVQIMQLIEQPALRETLSARSLSTAQKFSLEKMLARYLALVKELD